MTTPTLSLVEPFTVVQRISDWAYEPRHGPDVMELVMDQIVKRIDAYLRRYGVVLDRNDIEWRQWRETPATGPVTMFEGVWAGVRREAAWLVGGPRDRSSFTPRRDARGIPMLILDAGPGGGAPPVEYYRQGIRPEDGAWVYQYRPAVRR